MGYGRYSFEQSFSTLLFRVLVGQERFRALIPSYIRDCHAAVIVYDITSLLVFPIVFFSCFFYLDRESFEHIEGWVNDVRAERGDDVVIMIVGNKADAAERRSLLSAFISPRLISLFRDVPNEDGEAKAKELECLFSEASAKAGYNVKVFCLSLSIVFYSLG